MSKTYSQEEVDHLLAEQREEIFAELLYVVKSKITNTNKKEKTNTDITITQDFKVIEIDECDNIICIERNSDNNLFKIGDIIITSNNELLKIQKFYIKQNRMMMHCEGEAVGRGHVRMSKMTKLCRFDSSDIELQEAAKRIALSNGFPLDMENIYNRLKNDLPLMYNKI